MTSVHEYCSLNNMRLFIHDVEHDAEQGQMLLTHVIVDLLTDLVVAVLLKH
jgi:hypothetical protein